MSIRQKFTIFEKMYSFFWFWLIFVEILHYFGWVFATRIRFMKRIRLAEMKRIQTDPDPQHWLKMFLFLYFW